ncbi:hypothetical protein [Candidatus Accumulibacter vicinus]|uniref:Uncharacterized protein n=1 Tax=Candidatus Accumulibacter vicinus TaxID=2954382 RepID=A0A084XU90_9PROT|nr:hypothetical protein [Candidatus Accumulibacter vicinus]KFB66034.1 MAG: hypothetical protein CAPSK01_004877 [Candidatus Accumulibacter vicinus]
MELEPPNLNVRLEPRNYLWLAVFAACVLIVSASAFVNKDFALVFVACVIVGSPCLIWFFSPSSIRLPYWGGFERVAAYALFFAYLALAKQVLVPFVVRLLEHAFV